MGARVITFSVQHGSGGAQIAQGVAELVGFRLYDREVVSGAAREAGVSPDVLIEAERMPSLVQRIMQFFAEGAMDDSLEEIGPITTNPRVDASPQENYRELIGRVIRELAKQQEVVIIGHAAQIVLRNEPNVLRVLTCGSLSKRSERLSAEGHTSPDDATSATKHADRERADFFKHVYGVDWLDPKLYDICVNTDHLSPASAIRLVANAVDELA